MSFSQRERERKRKETWHPLHIMSRVRLFLSGWKTCYLITKRTFHVVEFTQILHVKNRKAREKMRIPF